MLAPTGLVAALLLPLSIEDPVPPPLTAPEDATVLFEGHGLDAWRRWEAGTDGDDTPRWNVEDGALIVRPGAGDLITRSAFGDYHLHLDFLVPEEPASVPDEERGASGVILADRYEVALLDSWRKGTNDRTCGAIAGHAAPRVNAAAAPGTWQALDVTLVQGAGEPARISVWLNDVRVQDDVLVGEAETVAAAEGVRWSSEVGEESEALDLGRRSWTVAARFRSRAGGTLVSKCPPAGKWVPDAKALFLRGGRLVYDIGWVGALSSKRQWNDGEWHRVVLTSDGGQAELWVDGELEAERDEFAAADTPGFVMKVGAANEDFGGTYEGDVSEVAYYSESLPAAEARRLSANEPIAREAQLEWSRAVAGAPPLAPGETVRAPIRLQAEGSAVRFANVWVAPLGATDHAGLIESFGPESYARGKEIYSGLCVLCHGDDGRKPTNPKARPFALGVLANGSDPLSLFRTVTDGYREMPGNAWLRPDQRYDVIHFLREEFLREQNPSQHFEVDDEYLNALPKGRTRRPPADELELAPRDFGAALAIQLGREVGAGLAVRLDEDATIGYDLQTMQSVGAWTGGFVELGRTHHYEQRGEGIGRPKGEMLPGLDDWGWGYGGALDLERSKRAERAPLPREMLDYHGYYDDGEGLVLSYAIDGREVLERPGVDRSSGLPVITHRLWIGPGEQELALGAARSPDGAGVETLVDERPGGGAMAFDVVIMGLPTGRVAVAAVRGAADWELRGGSAVLRIPASNRPIELSVMRTGTETAEQLRGFVTFLDNVALRAEPRPLPEATRGGEPRWPQELVTRGTLGDQSPYALDTLTLPKSNPWNAWLRTSALDFFEDGRAAVSTYGGDVWIVSGIDDTLAELRWKRFAAGLFEPMGVRVIDGQIYVTCRDRIVRLHDRDENGEADFYESFFPDPDVTASFHSFSFDLQTDAEGFLYYAKSGQYTDYALPGAVLKVAPDGRSHEVYCTGLRTPNGMGMSPSGRPLVSDNQGNWIPASKISLAKPGGFYGVFKSINTHGPGEQTRDDFDPPVVWMPQRLDSSSGGQLWLDDARFGPLSGRYLHTSFGKGWMYALTIDEELEPAQGAVWRLPFQFAAGIQRLRTNPADGQVYTVGLTGWQGPSGGADGCLQRVRYTTGGPGALLLDARVRDGRVELEFSAPLARASANDADNYRARRWNYRWARSYGSAHYSLERPGEEGEDPVEVLSAALDERGTTVRLELADLRPVDQLEVAFQLESAAGTRLEENVFMTLHRVP